MRQHHHRQGQQSKPGERIGGGKLSSHHHHYHYYWNKRFTLLPPYLIPDQRRGRIDCSSIIGIIANGPWFREHQSRGKKKKKGGRAFPLVLLSAFDPISIFMPLSTLFNHLYIPIIKMLLLLMRTVVVSFKESLKMKAVHHHNNYRSVDAEDDVAGWWSTEGINRFVVAALLPNNINIRVINKPHFIIILSADATEWANKVSSVGQIIIITKPRYLGMGKWGAKLWWCSAAAAGHMAGLKVSII